MLLEIEPLAAHYQIVLTREGRLDEMEICVECRPEHASADARRAAALRLVQMVKDRIGVSAKATVTEPGGVERSGGKARRVIDKRPKS